MTNIKKLKISAIKSYLKFQDIGICLATVKTSPRWSNYLEMDSSGKPKQVLNFWQVSKNIKFSSHYLNYFNLKIAQKTQITYMHFHVVCKCMHKTSRHKTKSAQLAYDVEHADMMLEKDDELAFIIDLLIFFK